MMAMLITSAVLCAVILRPAQATEQQLIDPASDSLKLGFVTLANGTPLVAEEKAILAGEDIQVELVAQPLWRTLLDNVMTGELGGVDALSSQPLISETLEVNGAFGHNAGILRKTQATATGLQSVGERLDETNAASKLVNREAAVRILFRSGHLVEGYAENSNVAIDSRAMLGFGSFNKPNINSNRTSDAVWMLLQTRRGSRLTESKLDNWYSEPERDYYHLESYLVAASLPVDEGLIAEGTVFWNVDKSKQPTDSSIDDLTYDRKQSALNFKVRQFGY